MQPVVNGFPKRQLVTLLIALPALAGVFVLAGSAVATPSISSKRAAANQAMEQINQMDMKLEEIGNKWEGARVRLSQTNTRLSRTRYSLGLARKSLGASRHALAKRLISVYMEQDNASDSTVAILFEASSLQDVIDRVEAAQRISDHDATVVRQVKALRDRTATQAAALQKLQAKQQAYVSQISSQWNALKRQKAEREAYVASVRKEIASALAEQKREAAAAAAQAKRTVASYNSGATVSSPVSPSYTAPAASSVGAGVVNAAMSRLNAPYVWGAAGPTTFDCSGLVVWSFAQVGISLPHYSYDLMNGGAPVSPSDLQPGDLVFFYGGGHVGIYIGGGQFIHAPHTGTVVQVTSLSSYGLTAARRYG
jgi:cell wall-associated NlpC family hydrolase